METIGNRDQISRKRAKLTQACGGLDMIKDNQRVFNRLLVLIDALITALSLILGYVIKFYVLLDGPGPGVLPLRITFFF